MNPNQFLRIEGGRQLAATLLGLLLLSGCSTREGEAIPSTVGAAIDLSGDWRAILHSPGGELPFGLRIERDASGYQGWILNGSEEAPLSSVTLDGDQVVLDIDYFGSQIKASAIDGQLDNGLSGMWSRQYPTRVSRLDFSASRGSQDRFGELDGEPGVVTELSGIWSATFTDEDGASPARAEFTEEDGHVTGTFLTPTGDYRFLEGSWQDGLLRLSTFDGAHAFLFRALGQTDGTLRGDFWSRDSYHATWTAERVADPVAEASLPDPWTQVSLTNPEGRFRFAFEDLDGNLVSHDDSGFVGKVVVVNLFGSWCPNCNDEAPLLAAWSRDYANQGLEIVGLAYEFTQDTEMLRRFGDRHAINYPLLLAGSSDKAEASATVPDISGVLAYPTTLFVGRDGRVRKIHSGFAGPGTGEHHQNLVQEMTETLEFLLAESVPAETL